MIDTFLRSQRVLLEERRDRSKLLETSNTVFPSITVILTDSSEPEESLQAMEHVEITLVLNDTEFRYDLEPDLGRWVSLNPDEEASFSIDKSNHPIRA
jgi:hypothetical protein